MRSHSLRRSYLACCTPLWALPHTTHTYFSIGKIAGGNTAQNVPFTGNKACEEWQGKAKQLSAVDIEKAQGEWSDGTWADFNPVSRPKLVVGENASARSQEADLFVSGDRRTGSHSPPR